MDSNAQRVVEDALGEALRPDPLLTTSEWADAHRILSQRASSEPGEWRTARTPYLREIMDCLSVQSPVREVWFQAATQVGKTEAGNNWIGYVIDVAPGPMLAVQPTLEMQKRNVKSRIDPMISGTPRLQLRVAAKRSRDSGNTMLAKEFPGGILVLTGANSAVGLRSMPARYLFLDEIDAYPGDLDGEGDPLDIAKARARTYMRRRKVYHVSSPTIAGRSKIANGYSRTDQRRYFVPCPHCNHMQFLVWSGIRFNVEDRSVPAVYVCSACGAEIEERWKTAMMAEGAAEWRPTAQGEFDDVRGYHLSSLYSPLGWYSWNDARDDFLSAIKPYNHEKHRTFINTVLAETWEERGDAPDWEKLYRRRLPYKPGTVPEGGLFLTAGADVQADRIEVEVVAWGRERRSWSVDYVVIPGDPFNMATWVGVDSLLNQRFEHALGPQLQILSLAVDSGYATQAVYYWTRKYDMPRVIAVKGVDRATLMIGQPTIVDVDFDGKTYRRGARVWTVGSNTAKSELYGWLRQELPKDYSGKIEDLPQGFCNFPEYGENYFKGLTAEELKKHNDRRGYVVFEWVKKYERNEPLDCRVYARAAAALLGMDRMAEEDWARVAAEMGSLSYDTPAPPPAPPPRKPPGGSGNKGGYW